MISVLRALTLALTLNAGTDPAWVLNYGNGLTAHFTFTDGPSTARNGIYESHAKVVLRTEYGEARRVRRLTFDAVVRSGQITHTLSDIHPPRATSSDGSAWSVSNIFFTMEKKWEGKLTLGFDDGTEQTEWFPIEVKRN